MAFPRLVTDNAIQLLKADDRIGTARPAKDDAEFFGMLKEKVIDDFNRMLESTDVDKKINALADLYEDIDQYATVLGTKEIFIDGKMKERREKMGGFEKRLLLESVEKGIPKQWTEEDVDLINKTGEADGYPTLNLGRNEKGQVYATLDAGKEAWNKQISQRLNNDETSQEHFLQFLDVVRRKDYVKTVQE